jgi:kynureninase
MKTRSDTPDLEAARALDARDALAPFRARFVISDPDLVYLDGNSLGRLPHAAAERTREVLAEWGEGLIGNWNAGWMDLPRRLGEKVALLVGADADEVLLADSTSVNLFKLSVAALRARPGRRTVVSDDLNFPSDLYVLRAALAAAGGQRRLRVIPSPDGILPSPDLQDAFQADTALVALSHTTFKSAYTHHMAAVTAAAHRAGALMLWDVSHSAGALPIRLREAGADLAVGCCYKYLNGGPGAPAFLYVRRELQNALDNPIAGWLGCEDPFRFAPEYAPAPGLRRFLTGTPPVLSLAAAEPGIDLLLEAGVERVRARSVAQTEYLIARWERDLQPLGYTLKSPRDAERRGSHVTLGHPEGLRISRALADRMRVVPDFRLPDNIRLGVAPLYTTFEELARGVEALARVVRERLYDAYPRERRGVT